MTNTALIEPGETSIRLERAKIRKVNPEGPAYPVFPLVDKPIPRGLAAEGGSIEKASPKEFPQRQPIALPSPVSGADYKKLARKASLSPELIPALAGLAAPEKPSQPSAVESIQKTAEIALSQDLKLNLPNLNSVEDLRKFVAELRNFQGVLAALQIRNDFLASEMVNVFDVEIQRDMERLELLNTQLKTTLAEHLKSVRDEKQWGVWQSVLQYFLAATSIVFGVALVATGVGVAAGAILIAAGGLTLINRLMSDTGGWKVLVSYFTASHDLQVKIANRIETGMFLLSLALSLTGGIMALQAGAWTELVNLDKAMKIVTLSTAVINGGMELAKGMITKRSQEMKAKILAISAETTAIQYDMQKNSSSIEETQKILQETVELVKRSISQLEVMLD